MSTYRNELPVDLRAQSSYRTSWSIGHLFSNMVCLQFQIGAQAYKYAEKKSIHAKEWRKSVEHINLYE